MMDPIPVERFGGLRLDLDPGEASWGAAIDVKNVIVDPDGTIRTRPGYDQVDSNTNATPTWLAVSRSEPGFVAINGTTGFRVYNTSYASTDTETLGFTPLHVAEGNDSGSSVVFVVGSPAGATGLYAYNTTLGTGSTVTQSDGSHLRGKFIAKWSGQDRMAVAPATQGASTGFDRVRFSNAGDGGTWSPDDYLDLDLADGESPRMLVGWGNLFFVFKDTKFYVFYGISTDATGGALFNYRTVDTGVSCGYDYAACAAQDGVYFVHADGVYRTNGGNPELVSAAIQPFFDARSNGFFTPVGPLTSPRIHAGDDRLYVWQQGAAGMFVMDLRTRDWTYWVLATAPYALVPLDTPGEFLFLDSNGRLNKFSPDFTDDNGTAIDSYYQAGFAQLAGGKQCQTRDFDVYGAGEVTLSVAKDFGAINTGGPDGQLSGPETNTLVAGLNHVRVGAMARDLSFQLSATSGVWSVSRLAARRWSVRDWT